MAHNVVVAVITKELGDKVAYLLISSKKNFGEYTGYYYPPGGHMEDGETEEETLIRELNEELGLQIKPIEKITTTGGDVKDQVTHWWRWEIVGGELHKNDLEIADANFFTQEQMKTMNIWPATKKFFEEFIFV